MIAQCKRRGNSGLNGEIVRNDNDHPDKLKRFYQNLGFYFVLFKPEQLQANSDVVGKIGMFF